MHNFRKFAFPIVLGALILGAVLTIGTMQNRNVDAAATTPPPIVIQNPPAQVTTAPSTGANTVPTSVAPAAPSGAKVSGNFLSANQVTLAFQMTGRVGKIAVKEGDRVKQGDLLAALDTSTLELQIAQAQAGLALAQARLSQTRQGGTESDIAAAKAAVGAAQANYDRVVKGPTADDLAIAKSNLDKAKAALDQAQSAFDKAGGASNPYVGLMPTSLNLQIATSNYQAAEGAFNLAKNHPTLAELAGAAVQLAQAESALAHMTPTAENLTIAQAGVDQAQAALALAQQGMTNARVVAPFDGTVIWLGPHVSEAIGSNAPMVIVADLKQMQVQANVDEITLAGVQVGQTVRLSVDALSGKTLSGKVKKIGLLATTTGGVVSVPVTIDVDPTDAPIYPGLSALVEFQEAVQ